MTQKATETCLCGASIEIEAYGVESILQSWRENHIHERTETHKPYAGDIDVIRIDGSIDLSKTDEFAIEEARQKMEP